MAQHLMSAASEAENSRYNMLESTQKAGLQKNIRFHMVEWHQKFVLSFACLIFFFIGAPLGAIIRKGGLGMPVVVSVALFIVYYIINNIGYKMARDGIWEAWQGMWLSSFALFPLGVFLTYKAMNDSALFNPEAYGKFIRKIFFIKTPPKISDERRNIIVKKIPDVSELDLQPEILNGLRAMDTDKLRDLIQNYKKYNYEKDTQLAALSILKERGAEIGGIIDKQDAQYMDNAEFLYDYSSKWTMAGYILCIFLLITNLTGFSWIIDVSYLFLFIRSMFYYFAFYTNIKKRSKLYHFFIVIFSFMFYPLVYFYVTRQIGKDKKEVEIISYS
jgi:lipopolysaccharide export system permease protein